MALHLFSFSTEISKESHGNINYPGASYFDISCVQDMEQTLFLC